MKGGLIRVGWISIGNDNFGSTRIGVTNIHKRLLYWGHFSTILNYNENFALDFESSYIELRDKIILNHLTCVVFHKACGPKAQALIQFCKVSGIKTVFANGDWNISPMNELADHVISGSPYVKSLLSENYNVKNSHYIDDALEISDPSTKNYGNVFDHSKINLGWFGNYTKLYYAKNFIKRLDLPEDKFCLKTISNTPGKNTTLEADVCMGAETDTPWDTVYLINYLLDNIDVVVLPINLFEGELVKHYAKTANRLTLAMSLGIPVIATPIPSYRLLISHGHNGFIPTKDSTWKEIILSLKDKKLREDVGTRTMEQVRGRYHIDHIIRQWIAILK